MYRNCTKDHLIPRASTRQNKRTKCMMENHIIVVYLSSIIIITTTVFQCILGDGNQCSVTASRKKRSSQITFILQCTLINLYSKLMICRLGFQGPTHSSLITALGILQKCKKQVTDTDYMLSKWWISVKGLHACIKLPIHFLSIHY